MATKNPRVVGYIQPQNHEKLKQFMEEYDVSESKALDLILGEYFGTEVPRVAQSSIPEIDSRINEAINQGLAQAIAPIRAELEELKEALGKPQEQEPPKPKEKDWIKAVASLKS